MLNGFARRIACRRSVSLRGIGLTRTQLRTGMKQLESEGIVWRHVGRGTFFGSKPEPAETEPRRADHGQSA